MKIEHMDICDCSTLAFQLLQEMTNKANTLKKEAERFEEVNRMLVYRIQEGKPTNTSDIARALSWLSHSTLTPEEIMKKTFDEEGE